MKECRQACFDLFGFGLWPGEPEELIICVPGISEPPVVAVLGIPAGQTPLLLSQLPRRGAVAAVVGTLDCVSHLHIGRVRSSMFSSGVLRYEYCLDKLVQPVQVDIGQDW